MEPSLMTLICTDGKWVSGHCFHSYNKSAEVHSPSTHVQFGLNKLRFMVVHRVLLGRGCTLVEMYHQGSFENKGLGGFKIA